MDGTTLCPHCETRFKIALAQLEAHQGLVRCGHCLKPFDARVSYIPDTAHPQLELAILDRAENQSPDAPDVADDARLALPDDHPDENAQPDNLDFRNYVPPPVEATPRIIKPDGTEFTLAEQVTVIQGDVSASPVKKMFWLWSTLALLSVLVMVGQVAYFFRADIAARMPATKPVLLKYCELLTCTVNLPQKNDLMSIESSNLEADPNNAAQITLYALLRSRANYPLAFPNLELTLNDKQDKSVARRVFKPADYLPPGESERAGLLPDHELNLKLFLDTADLNPNGYRLAVFYPAQH